MAQIVQLLVSPEHRYDGRPDPDVCSAPGELVAEITICARLGIAGDRYFNRPAHRDAAVTVMARQPLAPWPAAGLLQTRRNILLDGVDVDSAAPGTVLVLDSGAGEVQLQITRPASPCRWMDTAVGDGAWRALRGHGGMRCTPLTGGRLSLGDVYASWLR